MAKFREREMELLYKYFNENPTFEAYHAYKNFVKNDPLFVDVPLDVTVGVATDEDDCIGSKVFGRFDHSCAPMRKTDWVAKLLDRTTDAHQGNFFYRDSKYKNEPYFAFLDLLPLFLLMLLPRIKIDDVGYSFDIKEKVNGFNWLHGLVVAPETPLTKLAIYALLDAGANPLRSLTTDEAKIPGRMGPFDGQNALQLAQCFGRSAHAAIITTYLEQNATRS